jgi:rubrerythrin
MKMIKMLSEMIEEELEDAENYVRHALMTKERDASLAKTFFELSQQEMEHVNKLHTEVARLIEAYRKEHGEPPAAMLAVYDYLHEKHIQKAGEIKAHQAHYRET